MNDNAASLKGIPFHLEKHVDYAAGSVVSKMLIQKDIGNITLFAFDAGQDTPRLSMPSFTSWMERRRSRSGARPPPSKPEKC